MLVSLDDGSSRVPSVGPSLRHDSGDAEWDTGFRLSGGLALSDPVSGFGHNANVHALVSHAGKGRLWRRVITAKSLNRAVFCMDLESGLKTDRSDALKLARLKRSGDLTRAREVMRSLEAQTCPVFGHFQEPGLWQIAKLADGM